METQADILDRMVKYLLANHTPVPVMLAALIAVGAILKGATGTGTSPRDVLGAIQANLSTSADHRAIQAELERQRVLLS